MKILPLNNIRQWPIIAIVMAFILETSAGIRVTDAEDGMPLGGATVLSKSGIILGITDATGAFTDYNDRDLPLTIKCLGYKAAECSNGDTEVRMTTKDFQLPEYVVTAEGHPVRRMTLLVREYTTAATSSDTILQFNIHVGDIFYSDKKVKGFRQASYPMFRRCGTRSYHRDALENGVDSIYIGNYESETSWLQIMHIPTQEFNESERISGGEPTDSIMGKFGVKEKIKKTSAFYSTQRDVLADHKDHKWSPTLFKLFGLTVDFSELINNSIYRATDSGKYAPEDLISGTFSVKALAKGKMFKWMLHKSEPIEMNGYFEYYPVSIEYLTVEDAKELYNNRPTYRLKDVLESIPNLAPLPASIQTLVERAESQAQ